MKSKTALAIVIGTLGTFGLMAALHHVVVVTARGTAFSDAFAPTCRLCHGRAYERFGSD